MSVLCGRKRPANDSHLLSPSKRQKTEVDICTRSERLGSRSGLEMKGYELCRLSTGRQRWRGLDNITEVVVFGDSMTRFGDSTTWLGHFVASVNTTRSLGSPPIKVSSYAFPGATVEEDLTDQVAQFFSRFPAKKSPRAKPPFDPMRTLFVLWLGTNDCGQTPTSGLEEIIETLFSDGLDELYIKAGARNFLLIDVPPKDRCPSGLQSSVNLSERCREWNRLLRSHTETFAEETIQASMFLFSAHSVITSVLDEPAEFDFQEEDATEQGAGIWLDDLHLTSQVHAIIAERLEKMLRAYG